ncbi:hypothetical protein BDZ88DRAFT_401316 [Geranomyces variabilis]|nr:hypothetical protein BDZ88DRAFT_401316 [Geranomyces variabilis]
MRPSYAKDALLQQYAGLPVSALRSPALLVDRKKVHRNCRELLDAVQRAGLDARVHVKTHKTIEAALMQLGLDDKEKNGSAISAIMVSTLAEARAFAVSGRFNDILYAVPLSPDKIQEVHQLSQLVDKFHVFVDNDEIIDALGRYAMAPMFRAFLKIDTGYGRAGVPASNASAIKLATRLHNSSHIDFSGLYSHSGHSYSAPDIDAALAIVKHEVRETLALAQLLRSLGVTAPHVSVGATPSVKALLQVAGAAREAVMEAHFRLEVHLGNYVFLDVQQHAGMPWPLERCAATVLSRVLSVYPEREEVLIDAGALALSKDGPGPRGTETFPGFGAVLLDNDNDNENKADNNEIGTPTSNNNASSQRRLTVTRISQEHGVISTRAAAAEEQKWRVGQTLRIVPNHACLAAANFEWYYVIEDGEVADVWVPCRGW